MYVHSSHFYKGTLLWNELSMELKRSDVMKFVNGVQGLHVTQHREMMLQDGALLGSMVLLREI